ncbi:deoxyribodipyrimidine photo-lyase [Anoxynatronum buryatiense]|nr:deoxyribodipyrimidine photo-lyase [Anoxynatronum buryatiense]
MKERIRVLQADQDIKKSRRGPVVFWMSRDQRAEDHWGLIYARGQAEILRTFLVVVFCIAPNYLLAKQSHYHFMIQGLKEVAVDLENKGIPFHVIQGKPQVCMPKLISEWDASMLVMDFNPLRIKRDWENQITEAVDCAVHQVDSHNIVPCWKASDKLEYAAYTFRPRIMKKLKEYMTDYPPVASQKVSGEWFVKQNWEWMIEARNPEKKTFHFQSGKKAAFAQLKRFLERGIHQYGKESNQPLSDAVSRLSPSIHFGQISTQRIALEIIKSEVEGIHQEAFLEQLIVRRELSDNFCFYQPLYDQPAAFPRWARETLSQHENDQREYLYTREELESAATHDMLWNAAQLEMKWTGYLHGYLRMYWAKKILEWSPDAATAQQVAIYLNDTYLLDGRDPNGYAGIAWSIGGVHDRAWAERSVFGKIRYMNSQGCRRKFDIEAYITGVLKGIEEAKVK